MENFYSNMVKNVGDLILMGVWYSDACEVVMSLSDPSKHMNEPRPRAVTSNDWWDSFEESVNLYLDGKIVPLPNYKPIY